jgi:hypothetical protein
LGRGGRRFKSCHSDQHLAEIQTSTGTVCGTVSSEAQVAISSIDRKKVADFVAAQRFRTEAFYKGLENNLSRKDFGPLFTQLWDSSFILSARIEARHWILMVIDHDDVFYLGDQPVVLQRTFDLRNGIDLGFDVQGVEAFSLSALPALSLCHVVPSATR